MKSASLILLALSLLIPATAMAGDVAAGKSRAAMCAGCHGPAGISSNPLWPNLAGQKERYLAKQLRDFRSGARKDSVMGPLAAALTDADIENLAAYYASLEQ